MAAYLSCALVGPAKQLLGLMSTGAKIISDKVVIHQLPLKLEKKLVKLGAATALIRARDGD